MQQIADWLGKLGLSEYAERFAENDIDFTILSDLTDQDLEKIGIASLGHRRKLLRAIANLETIEKSAPAVAVPAPAAPLPLDIAERRQVTVMFSDLVGSTALSTLWTRKTYARSFQRIRHASPRSSAALVDSLRNIWVMVCSYTSAIRRPMRTTPSGQSLQDWS